MKKESVGWLVFFGILVAVLVILVFLFRPLFTGNVVAPQTPDYVDFSKIAKPIEEKPKQDEIRAPFVELGKPFNITSYFVSSDGVILEFDNLGDEDYVIRSIRVGDCGPNRVMSSLAASASGRIRVPCELVSGEILSGDIVIEYSTLYDRENYSESRGKIKVAVS